MIDLETLVGFDRLAAAQAAAAAAAAGGRRRRLRVLPLRARPVAAAGCIISPATRPARNGPPGGRPRPNPPQLLLLLLLLLLPPLPIWGWDSPRPPIHLVAELDDRARASSQLFANSLFLSP